MGKKHSYEWSVTGLNQQFIVTSAKTFDWIEQHCDLLVC